MNNSQTTPLKFSLELDSKGNYIVEMQGNAMEIGQKLFLPFFSTMNMEGKAIAANICTAISLAYPKTVPVKKRMNPRTGKV